MSVKTIAGVGTLDARTVAALQCMDAAGAVNGSRLGRERRTSEPVNVVPACLACGSYYVDLVDARLARDCAGDHELNRYGAYACLAVYDCRACGLVASRAAVPS